MFTAPALPPRSLAPSKFHFGKTRRKPSDLDPVPLIIKCLFFAPLCFSSAQPTWGAPHRGTATGMTSHKRAPSGAVVVASHAQHVSHVVEAVDALDAAGAVVALDAGEAVVALDAVEAVVAWRA